MRTSPPTHTQNHKRPLSNPNAAVAAGPTLAREQDTLQPSSCYQTALLRPILLPPVVTNPINKVPQVCERPCNVLCENPEPENVDQEAGVLLGLLVPLGTPSNMWSAAAPIHLMHAVAAVPKLPPRPYLGTKTNRAVLVIIYKGKYTLERTLTSPRSDFIKSTWRRQSRIN